MPFTLVNSTYFCRLSLFSPYDTILKLITKYYMQILDETHSRPSQLYQYRPHSEKNPCPLENQSINAVYIKNHSKIFYL